MESVVTKKLALDLSIDQYLYVQISQYDTNSREILISVTNEGKEYRPLQAGEVTVRLKYLKNDGHTIISDCDIAEVDDVKYVKVVLDAQMCSYPGKATAELLFIDADEGIAINTMPFYVFIKESAVKQSDVESKDEYTSFVDALIDFERKEAEIDEYIEVLDSNMEASYEYSLTSKSYAVGGAMDSEGNPYREGQDTDNSKYYSQQASATLTQTQGVLVDAQGVLVDTQGVLTDAQGVLTSVQGVQTDVNTKATQVETNTATTTEKCAQAQEYAQSSSENYAGSLQYCELTKDYYNAIQGKLIIKGTLTSTSSLPTNPNVGYAYFIDDGSKGTFEWDGKRWSMGTLMIYSYDNYDSEHPESSTYHWICSSLGGSGGSGNGIEVSDTEPLGQPENGIWYKPYN